MCSSSDGISVGDLHDPPMMETEAEIAVDLATTLLAPQDRPRARRRRLGRNVVKWEIFFFAGGLEWEHLYKSMGMTQNPEMEVRSYQSSGHILWGH